MSAKVTRQDSTWNNISVLTVIIKEIHKNGHGIIHHVLSQHSIFYVQGTSSIPQPTEIISVLFHEEMQHQMFAKDHDSALQQPTPNSSAGGMTIRSDSPG